MIYAQGLTKYFGPFLAIRDVTFSVARGEIVGFLGPNGSGKTTTMRILACVHLPTSGQATVAGCDVRSHSLEVRRHLGYLPENISLYPEMTVEAYLWFVARMKKVERGKCRVRIAEAIERMGLGEVQGKFIGNLSKGFRQRVGLAQALLNDPQVLILDEPTIGLDPEQAAEFRGLIRSMRGERTVILSTHILPEVQITCDRVMIIHRGGLIAVDTPENLALKLQDGHEITIRVRGPQTEVLSALNRLPGVRQVKEEGEALDRARTYLISVDCHTEIQSALLEALRQGEWEVLEMKIQPMSLEEIFLRLVAEGSDSPYSRSLR